MATDPAELITAATYDEMSDAALLRAHDWLGRKMGQRARYIRLSPEGFWQWEEWARKHDGRGVFDSPILARVKIVPDVLVRDKAIVCSVLPPPKPGQWSVGVSPRREPDAPQDTQRAEATADGD